MNDETREALKAWMLMNGYRFAYMTTAGELTTVRADDETTVVMGSVLAAPVIVDGKVLVIADTPQKA